MFQESSPRRSSLPAKTFLAKRDLEKAGYKVKVKSPWHLHVSLPDDFLLVNVWPTASKYMVDRDAGATVYAELIPAINKVFDRSLLNESTLDTPESLELADFRKDPLAYIKSLKK